MALSVVGSIALDSIQTPFSRVDDALGGSATYISIAASYFTSSNEIHLIGVVGEDFNQEYIDLLKKYNADLEGLQVIKGGKTFRWSGKYHYDFNVRDTLSTDLNVFENFNPIIPEKSKQNEFVLLGNIMPTLQLHVLAQVDNPKFVVCDTMNLWIETMKEELIEVLSRVDVIIINDSETRMLADEPNLVKAAKIIQGFGPKYLIIKKGEHGALLFDDNTIFSAAAYPLEDIYDPTGAGDAFAGGFTGYLHKTGDLSFENLKRAVIYGSTMASFDVEEFSTKGLENLTQEQIKNRFKEFKELTEFKAHE